MAGKLSWPRNLLLHAGDGASQGRAFRQPVRRKSNAKDVWSGVKPTYIEGVTTHPDYEK